MTQVIRAFFLSVVLLHLMACSDTSDRPQPLLPETAATPVNLIRAVQAPANERMLDIAVLRFAIDQGDKDEPNAIGDWVFTEILDIESQYLPTVLRKTLMNSNQWGIVRVLPKQDLSMDVSIQATIVQSDGVILELQVYAEDSTGRQWLNKNYIKTNLADLIGRNTGGGKTDKLGLANSPGSGSQDPFQDLYNQIANDLLAFQKTLTNKQLQSIRRVSEIKHARDLSPETFSGLLSAGDDGLLQVTRLLANNDPMLKRIERMQFRHNIFIDTLDDYYLELNLDMQPVYDLWRYYSREQIRYGKTKVNQKNPVALRPLPIIIIVIRPISFLNRSGLNWLPVSPAN